MVKVIWKKGNVFECKNGVYGIMIGREMSIKVIPYDNNRSFRIIRSPVSQDARPFSGTIPFEIRIALVSVAVAKNLKKSQLSQDVSRETQ